VPADASRSVLAGAAAAAGEAAASSTASSATNGGVRRISGNLVENAAHCEDFSRFSKCTTQPDFPLFANVVGDPGSNCEPLVQPGDVAEPAPHARWEPIALRYGADLPGSLIKRLLRPVVYRAEAISDRLRGVRRAPEAVFSKIHATSSWRGSSVSGTGSDPDATGPVLAALPELLASLGVRTLLDAPCGDGAWMAQLAFPLERYTGLDVVPAVIAAAEAAHGGPGR